MDQDLTNREFNGWTVLYRALSDKFGKKHWFCRCKCGTEKSVNEYYLLSGRSSSCGCDRKEKNATRLHVHGQTGTPTYSIWKGLFKRCYNEKDKEFKNYGARGISVCERWKNFENFLLDMGERPEGFTIERKENNGDYSPDNCKWATQKEQANNKRTNHLLTYDGRTQSLMLWAEELKLSYYMLRARCNRHPDWSGDRIIGYKEDNTNA